VIDASTITAKQSEANETLRLAKASCRYGSIDVDYRRTARNDGAFVNSRESEG